MKFIQRSILFVLTLTLCASLAQAGDWPQIEAALAGWEGPKQVTLRTDQVEPLAAPEVQDLLELLLEGGFVVVPATPAAPVDKGLILDHRTTSEGTVLALSRAADHAIIAFARQRGAQAAPVVPPPAIEAPVQSLASPPVVPVIPAAPVDKVEPVAPVVQEPSRLAPPPPVQALSQPSNQLVATEAGLPTGPIDIAGSPTGLAVLNAAKAEEIELVVQSGPALQRFRLTFHGLAETAQVVAPLASVRPLMLDSADLDGDGKPEIVAGWVQDQRGIYQGTVSDLHAWVYSSAEQSLRQLGGDLGAYVRAVQNRVFLQGRGAYDPFVGPVTALGATGGGYASDPQAVPWGGGNLYAVTPFSAEEALSWDEAGRLQVISRASGSVMPGTTLLADLGEFRGLEVAIPLETPEYRSGFSKEDQVREHYHPLPRRVSLGSDGAAYTIERGRTSGLPLIGKPGGKDAVVRVVRDRQGLRLERPFVGVEAFILDFGLVERPGQTTAALLLLNENADGSGRAWLQLVK